MKPFKFIEIQKSRDFGQILSVTFAFLAQNLKNFGKSLLFISAIPIIVSVLFSNYIMFDFIYDPQTLSQELPNYFLSLFLSVLVTMVATVFITIIPVVYIKLYMEKKSNDITVNEVWIRSKNLFFKVYSAEIGVAIIVGFAFLLLIIPGIYVSIAFSLVPVILVMEESSFSESIGRSSRLISGHWWLTLGLIIVLYIVYIVISFVLNIPIYALTFISALTSSDPGAFIIQPDWKMKIATAISSISYLFYALFTMGLTFHYFSLKEKKEATGLFEKIDSINVDNDESPTVT